MTTFLVTLFAAIVALCVMSFLIGRISGIRNVFKNELSERDTSEISRYIDFHGGGSLIAACLFPLIWFAGLAIGHGTQLKEWYVTNYENGKWTWKYTYNTASTPDSTKYVKKGERTLVLTEKILKEYEKEEGN